MPRGVHAVRLSIAAAAVTVLFTVLSLQVAHIESELDTEAPVPMSYPAYHDPVHHAQSFTRFVCCHCHDRGPDWIHSTFFGTRRAAELHISRSAMCRAAGKGVKTLTTEYRPSKRVEDQEAGPVGGAGTWPVRPAAPGMAHRGRYRRFWL